MNEFKSSSIIEAKNYDSFIENLKIKYGESYKNKDCYYINFIEKLEQIRSRIGKYNEFDPVEMLYNMYFKMRYTCTDISEALLHFGINWKSEEINRQTKLFLGWNKRKGKEACNTHRKLKKDKNKNKE